MEPLRINGDISYTPEFIPKREAKISSIFLPRLREGQ